MVNAQCLSHLLSKKQKKKKLTCNKKRVFLKYLISITSPLNFSEMNSVHYLHLDAFFVHSIIEMIKFFFLGIFVSAMKH